jgi:hypothetical protein
MPHVERIAGRIVVVRGCKLILDSDLASLYGVETRTLLQAVRRNAERFPSDFLISLNYQDIAALRSQSVISKRTGRGGRSYAPMAFTEHGAIMAATVLNSPRAIEMSLYVVRAFVQLREALSANKAIEKRLDELEQKIGGHDRAIAEIISALRRMMQPPEPQKRRRIGFVQN